MALDLKPNQTIRVTIAKAPNCASARKTLERLFLKDKAVREPLDARSANFKELPKRRGGCIWTKRPNKIHPDLVAGQSAAIQTTAQAIRDLKSVERFIQVANA